MINQVVIPFRSLDIVLHSVEQGLGGRDKHISQLTKAAYTYVQVFENGR